MFDSLAPRLSTPYQQNPPWERQFRFSCRAARGWAWLLLDKHPMSAKTPVCSNILCVCACVCGASGRAIFLVRCCAMGFVRTSHARCHHTVRAPGCAQAVVGLSSSGRKTKSASGVKPCASGSVWDVVHSRVLLRLLMFWRG